MATKKKAQNSREALVQLAHQLVNEQSDQYKAEQAYKKNANGPTLKQMMAWSEIPYVNRDDVGNMPIIRPSGDTIMDTYKAMFEKFNSGENPRMPNNNWWWAFKGPGSHSSNLVQTKGLTSRKEPSYALPEDDPSQLTQDAWEALAKQDGKVYLGGRKLRGQQINSKAKALYDLMTRGLEV